MFLKSKLREAFFEQDENRFCSPNFVMLEIFEHKEKLFRHSQLSEAEIYGLLHRILDRIHFVNEHALPKSNKLKAYRLCKDIDEDDTPFVALVLELKAHLWTGDIKFKKGLQTRGFDRFFESSK